LPAAGSHPFYARLNQLLRDHAFDDFAEAQCADFYADTMGRPGGRRESISGCYRLVTSRASTRRVA
jgi:hypothetical protein